MTTPMVSSATSGFFQSLPTLLPQYSTNDEITDDRILTRILKLYLPSPTPSHVSQSLHNLSRRSLDPSTLCLTVDAETNHPSLHPLTTFGEENKVNPLRTSHGWRTLKDIGIEEGTVGFGYHQPSIKDQSRWNRRVHQFAALHLWHPTAALTTCPMAMTDGAAVLLSRHLSDPDDALQPGRADVFKEAYRRLTSLDPREAWTSGQWMTERSGGSNVSGTETRARLMSTEEIAQSGYYCDSIGKPLGPWIIDGFKWFSSATDADVVVLLAQTPKGLSAFYAPMRRRLSRTPPTYPAESNGVRIIRLKDKLGTKALPTAELEIRGMRAYLIGHEGQGIKEISSVLNITRLWTASGIAVLGRGLAVSRAYSKIRHIGPPDNSHLLSQNTQHVKWMADETVKYWAATHLSFFGVALLGASEQPLAVAGPATTLIPSSSINRLLRIITPVAKAQCSLASVSGLRNCIESLGGVGYCENDLDFGIMNLARLYRNANVSCIWEGTTSVMADDVVRVLYSPNTNTKSPSPALETLQEWVTSILTHCSGGSFESEIQMTSAQLQALLSRFSEAESAQELQYSGREVLESLETVVCSCLLMSDATSDGDEIATAAAKRWVFARCASGRKDVRNWKEEVKMDRRIFLGDEVVRKGEEVEGIPRSKL